MSSPNSDRIVGVALVLLSALAWSLNGLYARLLTVDLPTTLTGRAIGTSTMLFVALLIIRGRATPGMIARTARRGIVVIVAGSLCMISFIAALFYTTVANVTVIYAIAPLIAAVLARFLIGDPIVARTFIAFVTAMLGTVIMVGASFGTERLLGDLLAVLMSATFAIVIVEMRRKPDIDNLTSSLLTSMLTAAALASFATLGDIDLRNAFILFLFGFTSNVLGFFLFIAAVRKMPPAEAGLIATIEIVLAPFWVWLFFVETPGQATLVGGGIIVAAVIFQITGELRQGRRMAVAEGLAAEVENLR
jgi:drug/metabolite transporter (DMT)-like permease